MELLNSIENVIILYAPSVMLFLTQMVDWIFTYKKFTALSVKKQVAPLMDKVKELTDNVAEYQATIDALRRDNELLKETIATMNKVTQDVNEGFKKQNECMHKISRENIELKAAIRRGEVCVAKEQENV